jgi:predicted ATPase/DNA-binding SARP family transcriptional activator
MEFRVLGSLEVVVEDGPVTIGGAKQRALLAVLLVHANSVVSADRLADVLWGDAQPADAAAALQTYVSRLRAALEAGTAGGEASVLVTRAPGYVLCVAPEQVDAWHFECLVSEGVRLTADGEVGASAATLGEALGLWRGRAFAEFADDDFARNEAVRLEELRRLAIDERVEARLRLGCHWELVGELNRTVASDPLRERPRAQLMLALYRCGREAEALRAYQDLRRYLADELGIEPSRELVGLEEAMLLQKSELDWKPPEPASGTATEAVERGAGPKGNLPASLDRFVGRGRDLDAIRGLLGERRLVTLTGPGGSGKTRLALEVARALGAECADGVWLVDLATVEDEHVIAEATMGVLGLRSRDTAPTNVLRSHLAGRDALLVVDNCEHVLGGAAALIVELLTACPDVRVLATSREPLRVPGETEYLVEGLVREEAVELLADRVPRRDRIDDADAAERICVALEGIPLAIELAAARMRVLSAAELADRLDDQLAALTRGTHTAPQRQRTLRATLDWSYDLLDEDERVVFRRVAIFAAGFGADAAETVVADDRVPRPQVLNLLERLVERSLLTRVPRGLGARFRLLEPIRQYAVERLADAGERNALGRRHLEWCRDFAQRAWSEFFVEQRDSTIRIRQEHPNISQALEFALDNGRAIDAATIIGALGFPWHETGQPDGRLWCERVVTALPPDAPGRTRADALVANALILQNELKYDTARSLLLEALELYRSAKHLGGEAWALNQLAWHAFVREPASAEAKTLFEQALSCYRESNVPAGAGAMLVFLAEVALNAEDDVLARRRAEEAVQLGKSTHIGNTVAWGTAVLAILDSRAGDFESADRRLAQAIAMWEAAGARGQLLQGHALAAELAASRGDLAQAASHLAEIAAQLPEVPKSGAALVLIASTAYVAYTDGRAHDAATLVGACLGLSPYGDAYSLTIPGSIFPKRFRPILEALENQGLHEEIAAGANLSVDEALEHVAAVTLYLQAKAVGLDYYEVVSADDTY